MKRIFLFLMTNIAVMVLLSVVVHLLGVDRWLSHKGINYTMLLGFSAVLGFGGAFISLAISKWMAKWSVGAVVIEHPSNEVERWLVDTVRRQAQAAGIGMPEVAIFPSPDVNAFATGMSRDNALVAVSTGLLHAMSQDEAEAVLGHEISHVANGDMVTMTLLQGVVNTFVYFLANCVAYAVDRFLRSDSDESGPGFTFMIVRIVAEICLGVLATMIVMWFSRQREYRADAGGARLSSREKMIAALERLQAVHEQPALPSQLAAFGINSGGGMMRLFTSHPPLEERIAALRAAQD
jgi:heat shock protein HtpX